MYKLKIALFANYVNNVSTKLSFSIPHEHWKNCGLASNHLYQARWILYHYFPGDSLTFSFVSSDARSLSGFWWSNPESRLFVLSELPKIAYYWLWQGLLGIAENPEWAVELERVYLAFVREVFIRPLG